MKYFIINLLFLFSISYVYADEDYLYNRGYTFLFNEKIDINDIYLVEWGDMQNGKICFVYYYGKTGGEEVDTITGSRSKLECELLDSIVKDYKLKNLVKK